MELLVVLQHFKTQISVWRCEILVLLVFFKVHENHLISTVKELKMSQNAWGICVYEDIIVVSIEGKFNAQIFRFYDQEGISMKNTQ